ncbi:MAG: hypothetical protein KIS65_06310, partial [Nitrosomonas sp.]|nr:hypothetical protein [Nitrosomonas sp.]
YIAGHLSAIDQITDCGAGVALIVKPCGNILVLPGYSLSHVVSGRERGRICRSHRGFIAYIAVTNNL